MCMASSFSGPEGTKFNGSVEAQTIRSPPRKQLKLESLTRSLQMDAPEGIMFSSKAGDVKMTSLKDIAITSSDGKVNSKDSKLLFLGSFSKRLQIKFGFKLYPIYKAFHCSFDSRTITTT